MKTASAITRRGFFKKIAGGLLTLIITAGTMMSLSGGVKAASIYFDNAEVQSLTPTNAVVKIRANAGEQGRWSSATGVLYDSSGKAIARKTESADYYTSYMNIWYDIKEELHKSLKPGTKYYFQFKAVYNGVTYRSNYYEFRTPSRKMPTHRNNRVKDFLSDSRWADGTAWGEYQYPKLSGYQSTGCCAYTADFAKYVFGKDSPRAGKAFYRTSEIKANDILHIDGHWLVVLSKKGDNLEVAEANVITSNGRKVVVSTNTWTVFGNRLKNRYENFSRELIVGYHF